MWRLPETARSQATRTQARGNHSIDCNEFLFAQASFNLQFEMRLRVAIFIAVVSVDVCLE